MKQKTQIGVINELLSHMDQSTTSMAANIIENAADVYTSTRRARLEIERLFRKRPLVVGLSDDVRHPSSYWATTVLDVPIILIRDRNHEVKGYLNACRHRGTQLLKPGRGQRSRITCAFHAWTYDLDGSLIHVPRPDSVGKVDHDGHNLIELPVLERHGLIWIRLKPGIPIDADEVLGDLDDEIAGWSLGDQVLIDHRETSHAMNWKLANDTFGETYHFEFLHKRTLNQTYESNVLSYKTFDRNHRMVFPTRSIATLRNQPQSEWKLRQFSTIAYYLFPNTQLLISPRSIELYRILPEASNPNQCRIHQSVYMEQHPKSDEERKLCDEILRDLDAVIFAEDFKIAEDAQAGLHSGLLDHVQFARNEPALQHYHTTFTRELGLEELTREHANG